MKPPKFHVGQAVVCLISDWLTPDEAKGLGYPGVPKKGVVYKVEFIKRDFERWCLRLVGVEDLGWDEQYFAPVEELPAEALAELLEESFAVTA